MRAVGIVVGITIATATPTAAPAAAFHGPGRFCGYSAIIDLLPGELIETGSGGIHGGSFRWTGTFGTLDVSNTGWAAKPHGRQYGQTKTGQSLVRPRGSKDEASIVVWNRRSGTARFTTGATLTAAQLSAIDRVYLFDELDDEPEYCKYRTIFSYE